MGSVVAVMNSYMVEFGQTQDEAQAKVYLNSAVQLYDQIVRDVDNLSSDDQKRLRKFVYDWLSPAAAKTAEQRRLIYDHFSSYHAQTEKIRLMD